MNTNITDIKAVAITNSRGKEVISVTVEAGAHVGTFALPEGASTGSKEVHVVAVDKALEIVRDIIAPALKGKNVCDQEGIDALLHELDPTSLFENIGGNVALGVSVAACKAAAIAHGLETWEYIHSFSPFLPQGKAPRLFVNLINGGKHAAEGSPIQEHQIIPDTDDVALAYELATTIQEKLEEILKRAYALTSVPKGDEGGFVIPSKNVFEPFLHLEEAIDAASLSIPVSIGTDIAASSFYEEGLYALEGEPMHAEALLDFYEQLHSRVPLLRMIEDPFFEADGASYAQYAAAHRDVLVIGDDLTTTNVELLEQAIALRAITGIIIKPNQIGTLTDTLKTMAVAYKNNIRCIVSHRSGETMDDFIADLAWATGAYGFKAGAPHAKERDVKYRRLIQIQKSQHA